MLRTQTTLDANIRRLFETTGVELEMSGPKDSDRDPVVNNILTWAPRKSSAKRPGTGNPWNRCTLELRLHRVFHLRTSTFALQVRNRKRKTQLTDWAFTRSRREAFGLLQAMISWTICGKILFAERSKCEATE